MDHSHEVYNCELKEAWRAFLELMKDEDPDDLEDIVFVYDKDDEIAWAVENHRLDDFAEELWDNCALWEKQRDEEFEDFVIIKLISEETKELYPALYKDARKTLLPGIYRSKHHFHVEISPSFGSNV
jgi:hypothetical protein